MLTGARVAESDTVYGVGDERRDMWVLVWYAVVGAVCTALIWRASGLLEGSAERLALHYGLPAIVQGAVIVAIGSSMPELLTAIIAPLVHDEFELGVGVIVGSAIFNVLVIPAAAALASEGGLSSGREVVYKEAQFYMLAVAVFLLMCSFAVIYYPVDGAGTPLGGTITRELALIPVATYGLYVFIQYSDTMDHEPEPLTERIDVRREWLLLLLSFAVIAVAVEGLVRMAIGLGEIFDTPSFIWGLTVIAAATSLPDAFVSIAAAKREHDVTSIANVFGSNVFDLLVAVPAGVLVAGAAAIDFSQAIPLIGFLMFGTVVLFTLLRTEFVLEPWEAYVLLGLYAVFVVWVLLETVGFTGVML